MKTPDEIDRLSLATSPREQLQIELALIVDDINNKYFGMLPAAMRETLARLTALLQGIIELLPERNE